MADLKNEETSNLKFDIELITEERDYIQAELEESYRTIDELSSHKLSELQNQVSNLKLELQLK